MKIPAQAYAQRHPKDLPAGALFKYREIWSLRVAAENNFEGLLLLGGKHAGGVLPLETAMGKALTIIEPFAWYPTVLLRDEPKIQGERLLSLMLSPDGPVVIGDAVDTFATDYLAFGMDGRRVELQDTYSTLRFAKWSLELCRKERPDVSLGTLVEIDRTVT